MAEVAPEPIPSSSTGGGLAFPEMGEEVEPEEAAPEEVTPEEVAPEEAAPEEVIPEEEAPEPIPSSISTKETVLSEIAEEVVPEPFPSSSSTDDDTIMSPFMDIYLEPEPPGGTELETLSGKPIPYTKLKQYDVAKFTNLIGERQECKSKHGTVYEFWLTTECPKETVQDRIAKRSDPDYCKEELFLETEEERTTGPGGNMVKLLACSDAAEDTIKSVCKAYGVKIHKELSLEYWEENDYSPIKIFEAPEDVVESYKERQAFRFTAEVHGVFYDFSKGDGEDDDEDADTEVDVEAVAGEVDASEAVAEAMEEEVAVEESEEEEAEEKREKFDEELEKAIGVGEFQDSIEEILEQFQNLSGDDDDDEVEIEDDDELD